MNYKQLYAIKEENRRKLALLATGMKDKSGIYVWYRVGADDGKVYFYAGQSVRLVDRSIAHMMAYDHLGLSIRKRGLFNEKLNPYGWNLIYFYCDVDELDEKERETIALWSQDGISYNVTDGGQGAGKKDIGERKPAKGYMDGKKQGYLEARRYAAKLFDKNLAWVIKDPDKNAANKVKAAQRWEAFISVDKEDPC